jgi:hypothetical protein
LEVLKNSFGAKKYRKKHQLNFDDLGSGYSNSDTTQKLPANSAAFMSPAKNLVLASSPKDIQIDYCGG